MQKPLSICAMRDDASLPMLIRQIRDGLLRQIQHQIDVSGIGINYSQYLVLKVLALNGPQMPGDLARFLDHDAGAMTRLIDRLEDKRYVQRKPHAEDRRALTIELTAAGQKLWSSISHYVDHAQERALRDLEAADRAKLFELLRHVRDSLDGNS